MGSFRRRILTLLFAALSAIFSTVGIAAQLPEPDAGEDVPRQAPLPPPSPSGEPTPGQDGEPRATFGDSLDVAISFHIVRVSDQNGTPVLGLGPEDFRAIGEAGEPRTVVAAEWHDSGRAVEHWTTPRRGTTLPPDEAAVATEAAAPAGARLADLGDLLGEGAGTANTSVCQSGADEVKRWPTSCGCVAKLCLRAREEYGMISFGKTLVATKTGMIHTPCEFL